MGKKKKCPEGHHGGSWKVAFADFMTAMFALFLVLWLVGLKPEQKQGIENYFKNYSIYKQSGTSWLMGSKSIVVFDNNSGKSSKKPESNKKYPVKESTTKSAIQKKLMEEIKKQFKYELGATNDQVIVEQFKDGIRIQLVDSEGKPMYNLGSSDPTAIARKAMKIIASQIKDTETKIAIEGHTDALAYSSSQYTNWELSTERASAARRELERNGVNPDNLVSVSGYADTRPLIKEDKYDQRNRRISILLNVKPPSFEEVDQEGNKTPSLLPDTTSAPETAVETKTTGTPATHEITH